MSAIRDTILNNYFEAYVAPKVTRHDSHKKSELRDTYKSIVKLNKESPWYLPVTSKETQSFAISLKENARELRSSIAELGGLEADGMFDKKHASSTNEAIATATYIGEEQASDQVPSFELAVQKLATAQENLGRFLPDAETSLPEDTYSFDVNVGEMNYEFQFHISEGDTNRAVQSRLARLVNNSGIGLKADIVEQGNRSALRITAENTGLAAGKDRQFAITDDRTSKTSGTVDYLGLNNLSTEPSNAQFTINGEDRVASSNHFTVGKMYELSLNGVSRDGESTTIGLKADTESVTDNISQLVGSYNSFLSSVNAYLSTQAKSRQLAGELTGIARHYSAALADLGITMAEDGTMSVDAEKLQKTADSSTDLGRTFRTLRDFSGSLVRKTDQVALNPMEYVQRTVVAYKNPGHNFASPYAASSYTGMMFNYYC
ncbi:MAG: flagellar filament capping protein FliD [Lachnospiraceae bacterium]|nr:flagellar filament capping protein FliD [Lachnospiraceae bacterium]